MEKEETLFEKGEPEETWNLYYRVDSKGRRKLVRVVLADFDSFTQGLPEDEKHELAVKYNVPGFKIFLEGSKYMDAKLRPVIGALVNEIREGSLTRTDGDKRKPPIKKPRKLLPRKKYLEAIEATPRRNGHFNLSAIGSLLHLKDGKTVREHLLWYGIPIT